MTTLHFNKLRYLINEGFLTFFYAKDTNTTIGVVASDFGGTPSLAYGGWNFEMADGSSFRVLCDQELNKLSRQFDTAKERNEAIFLLRNDLRIIHDNKETPIYKEAHKAINLF